MLNPLNSVLLLLNTCWISTATFWSHLLDKKSVRSPAAREELVYHEAFAIVKGFLKSSGNGTVEDLQTFTSTPAPAPAWVLVHSVHIPPQTLSRAADTLSDYLGPEGIELAGGKSWWRQRLEAKQDLHAEWIAMKRDWDGSGLKRHKQQHQPHFKKPAHEPDQPYTSDIDDLRCMYYVCKIHGGGYYFGSIETHRYSIWRMARKMAGRAFTCRYRLAPAFPWPCALQDCLAGYLYLIQPPKDAPHKAVDPKHIVLAGDSAGGGIAIALLCLLRDLELPLPSSAVLISPWVDLTESMPSIMTNVDTDVIPPYGFLHKPSLLWPPPAPQEILESRQHMLDRLKKKAPELVQRFQKSDETPPWATTRSDFPSQLRRSVEAGRESGPSDLGDKVEPDDVVQVISEGKTITLKDQVHLHATNKQLSHPTVSPLLTPSLAGLPPLFIVAGDDEVLRDEIVRFAHRAAHPDRYPLRSGLLGRHGNQRRLELARDKKWQPTTVHLQVYDGMCHDICLFSFIQPAKYCYRAIASFCIRMTAPRYGTQSDASAADAKDSSGSDRASHANIDTLKSKASKPSLSSVGMSRKKDKDFNRGTMYFPELPDSHSPFMDGMVRERVDVHGVVRPMEPEEDLSACQIPNEDIGYLRAEVVKRYLQGRTLWDQKFKNTAKRVRKERFRTLDKAVTLEEDRLRRLASRMKKHDQGPKDEDTLSDIRLFQEISDDSPPPSALAARRDIQLSQIVSDVAHGDSPAGRKALKAWNRVQSLTWFGSDAAVESIEEPKITDSGERFTEEPQQLTESPVDFRLPQKQNSE